MVQGTSTRTGEQTLITSSRAQQILPCNLLRLFTEERTSWRILRLPGMEAHMRRMRRQWRPYLLALGFALGVTSNLLGADPTFTSIDFPGAASTQAHGINPRGDIVGEYVSTGLTHGFLLSGGSFTTVDFPGAVRTSSFGINPRGDIVGEYVSAGVTHGFLLSGGAFTPIDIPVAAWTPPHLINQLGATVR